VLAQAWLPGDAETATNSERYAEWEAEFLDRFEMSLAAALERRESDDVSRENGTEAGGNTDLVG
jgi:hypothetical protein